MRSERSMKEGAPISLRKADNCIVQVVGNRGEQVLEFDVSIAVGGTLVTEHCRGDLFSRSAHSTLKKAPAGTKFYVENVKVRTADGTIKKVEPITVTL